MKAFNRRRVLRGMWQGAAVAVALPFLDCFLDDNGTALAATGRALPIRFGTWFWGLGMTNKIFVPKKVGADYDLPEEIQSFADVKQHINIYSGFNVLTDGKPNLCHYTGWVGLRTGAVSTERGALLAPSIDVLISDAMGHGTRFRSLELAASGNVRDSYSFRSADAVNPPEISAVDLYQKIFGPEFHDPNSPTFTPDPATLTRKSALSVVMDDTADLVKKLGAADKARLDQYFTSVREIEKRLALQLEKPARAEACKVPGPINQEISIGADIEDVAERHKLMTDLAVQALACNQTKVVNMVFSNSQSVLTKKGSDKNHHVITHEEMIDDKVGYQVENSWFVRRSMEAWAYFVRAMASVQEGDGTLLDRSLIYAHSDQEYARVHSITGIPMMTAGSAGGKVKTGLHVAGGGQPGTRVGFTLQQVMGVPTTDWGVDSMRTSQPLGDILV